MKNLSKKLTGLLIVAVFAAMSAIPTFAAGEPFDAVTIVSDGISEMKETALPIIGVAIAAGLAIFGVIFGVRRAISALRSTAA